MFKATKAGAFVRRGKSWDCIDFTNLQSFGPSSGRHYRHHECRGCRLDQASLPRC
jgi:hypothetical protein